MYFGFLEMLQPHFAEGEFLVGILDVIETTVDTVKSKQYFENWL